MHKCVVCSNSTSRTRLLRPDVIYHAFPSCEFTRNSWLNVYGIESWFSWHRICSDHFLPEHYKPGNKRFLKKNILPLPYPNREEDGFPLSYTAESTDVEPGNNNLLARDQNLIREEQSTVVNNFESPRRSYRKIKLTTTNEDMSYENMPNLQTERFERQIPTVVANENIQPVIESVEVPVTTTTKDYTLGSGPLCSVKNCYNRYSTDLSFFGYPKDFALRKEWIEKCGLTIDPTEKVKSGVRVCRVHFEDHCFINTERKNRLRPNAVPSLFLDGENIEAKNKPSSAKRGIIRLKKRSPVNNGFVRINKRDRPSCSSTAYVANINNRQIPLLDFQPYCAVPECITNDIEEIEDISLFAATEDTVNEWSSILNLNLTINSIICERHFRLEDILYPTLLVDGADKLIKSLAPCARPVQSTNAQSATNSTPLDAGQSVTNNMPLDAGQSVTNDMPLDAVQSVTNDMPLDAVQSVTNDVVPLDAVQSASNARPLETNGAPVLRTYAGHLKRQKADGQLSSKKNKIDVLDKSKAATNKMYFPINENKEHTMVTNCTPNYNSTCDLDQNSESSTVIPVDLSIVKIEPNDDDNDSQTNVETKTKQLIKPEPVEDNNLLPLSSIDDSLSISLKKLKKISNSSLSITLEPIDSAKISEPSVNLLSKPSAKSSMSITLQPKLHNNLSSTTNNSSPSVSFMHSLPSTLSSSVYNISQQSPLQYKLDATSTSKMPDKLSSNTVVHPKIIGKQIILSKPITLTNTSNSSGLSKIKTPVISKCISLAKKSHIHSNSDYRKNNSDTITLDDDIDTEAFIQEDNGFIYEISKSVSLPNSSWKIEHINGRNSTHFYQQDNFGKFMRKISFHNSLFPTIHIHGKKYEYNKPIKTKNELHNLIEKIDGIYKCVGKEGFVSENCTGFFEGNSEGVHQCSSCQKKYQAVHTTKVPKFIIKGGGLEKIISEKLDQLFERKENIEDDGRSPSPEQYSLRTIVNCMVPRH